MGKNEKNFRHKKFKILIYLSPVLHENWQKFILIVAFSMRKIIHVLNSKSVIARCSNCKLGNSKS